VLALKIVVEFKFERGGLKGGGFKGRGLKRGGVRRRRSLKEEGV
jgi:hypothetical protein